MTRQAMNDIPRHLALVPGIAQPPLKIDVSLGLLLQMLTYKRPAFTRTEEEFIDRFIRPLGTTVDEFGNHSLVVGPPNPRILWSSHTDSVHHLPGRQKTFVKGDMVGVVARHPVSGKKTSNCLGADCAAGVWLMVQMIKAQVPGLYIFHRDEESGGNGSRFIAKNTPELLDGIDFAIAFDRKGYDSIITHQGDRTASNEFATSMAAILGGEYRADDSGTFTDTAVYVDLVGECSNISMGYFNGHGPTEILDLRFISQLRDTLVTADFSTLVKQRKAGDVDQDRIYGGWWEDYQERQRSAPRNEERKMQDLVYDNVDAIADLLMNMGYTSADIEEYLGLRS
jgi:hypothetical protein